MVVIERIAGGDDGFVDPEGIALDDGVEDFGVVDISAEGEAELDDVRVTAMGAKGKELFECQIGGLEDLGVGLLEEALKR